MTASRQLTRTWAQRRASRTDGVLWGQLTALAVELSAILAGTWSYVDDLWFNPVMFWFRGHPVTAAMQLTWLLAPLCFAALVRRLALTAR